MDELRKQMYEEVVRGFDFREEISDTEIYARIDQVISHFAKENHLTNAEKKRYREILFSSLRRFDVLSLAMDDLEVTEIMVNGGENIFIEKHGKIRKYEDTFTSPEKLSDIVQRIAASVNRRVNEATPMVDAGLKDGSRVNIVLPPIAIDGPSVTIRRFPKEPISMADLISWNSITEEAALFLKKLVESGYNIFISGGTGAGKTTFLGALAEYIPSGERVITIEDSAELRLKSVTNIVRLESRPPNLEGAYEITIRDLIRNALRMRPDRIIVGEIRSEEALDMLQAMNTGHDGSLSTGHANSAKDMLSRIETMVLMGKDLPLSAIRSQIASGIDILVHVARLRDKSRRVVGIYEMMGIREGEICLEPLYEFQEDSFQDGRVTGALRKTKHELFHTEKLIAAFGKL